MKTKKQDFIELDFIARIKDSNLIFDLTDKELAKKNNIHNENIDYKPIKICIGEGHVIQGLDKALENKEINKDYKIEIKAEEAFGKKDPRLIQIVSSNIFKKQNITPIPGLQVNIDNILGLIRSVSPGRVIIDFNHPLASRDLIYEIRINRIITDEKEKVETILSKITRDSKVEIKENELKVELKNDLPKKIKEELTKKIIELIPSIKKIDFKLRHQNADIQV